MFPQNPSELSFFGIYVAPALVVGVCGLLAAWAVASVLNRFRLSRYFWNPPVAFLAIWALLSALIGLSILAP